MVNGEWKDSSFYSPLTIYCSPLFLLALRRNLDGQAAGGAGDGGGRRFEFGELGEHVLVDSDVAVLFEAVAERVGVVFEDLVAPPRQGRPHELRAPLSEL